jgi:putative sterol carrier protein
MTRPGDLLARRFAHTVANSSPERLRMFVSGWRRPLVLGGIFRQMPKRLNRDKAKSVDAAVDWKIGRGSAGGDEDHYQVLIKEGKGRVTRKPTEAPRATIHVDAVDFLRLAAGTAQGPELFMSGKLRIEGDIMFTAQLASLFRIPAARG